MNAAGKARPKWWARKIHQTWGLPFSQVLYRVAREVFLSVVPVECEALLEPVLAGGLHEALVVLGERHQEDDRRHVLEAVDPLAPLRTLVNVRNRSDADENSGRNTG